MRSGQGHIDSFSTQNSSSLERRMLLTTLPGCLSFFSMARMRNERNKGQTFDARLYTSVLSGPENLPGKDALSYFLIVL